MYSFLFVDCKQQNDRTLFNQLDDLERIANPLCERIEEPKYG
jgi:hypothetical protein